MSIFGSIVSAIFGSKLTAEPEGGAPQSSTASASGGTTASTSATPASSGSISRADVEAQITKILQAHGGRFNWQTSIVDLMKLLNLDSSLTARKQLAQELGYTGDLDDTAQMNVWLHEQVMEKLAQSGGKVPAELKV